MPTQGLCVGESRAISRQSRPQSVRCYSDAGMRHLLAMTLFVGCAVLPAPTFATSFPPVGASHRATDASRGAACPRSFTCKTFFRQVCDRQDGVPRSPYPILHCTHVTRQDLYAFTVRFSYKFRRRMPGIFVNRHSIHCPVVMARTRVQVSCSLKGNGTYQLGITITIHARRCSGSMCAWVRYPLDIVFLSGDWVFVGMPIR